MEYSRQIKGNTFIVYQEDQRENSLSPSQKRHTHTHTFIRQLTITQRHKLIIIVSLMYEGKRYVSVIQSVSMHRLTTDLDPRELDKKGVPFSPGNRLQIPIDELEGKSFLGPSL
ncbi:hypothetical protein TTHERM_001122829 (macronuclear) [Tetrahymena thermophila SB210]|uniref:Uncharacterized protein n=1 Tax=Tetrahymena thermophila (strain SB210) TaxID=312017 RepID=W7X2N1_TETTS|nr:hypothetical protein TTHERM_001122829 [Tetrahymena thermophila SB210]EWS73525.1 hypothetical protein TTHERM_001122829 [Tetrahymena thermophila SB210]|eukprot:XP_012653950.1 hypothetical protein TTHERM_001122829 [Tetrahymena thermophila SB210]